MNARRPAQVNPDIRPKAKRHRRAAPRVMRSLPLSEVYRLLEPGPVVLLTTCHKGRANVMAMSWHMMIDFEPPLVGCVVSAGDFSFNALQATKQCVIAIPSSRLARAVVSIGNCSGRDVRKFEKFALTPMAAEDVTAPLIAECLANLECVVTDTRFVRKYNLFILEVVKAWTDPNQSAAKTIHHHGFGRFVVDGRTIVLKSRMK